MMPFRKTTAALLFLLIWLGTFDLAVVAKRRLETRPAETGQVPTPFAFAEPTEEELEMIRAGQADSGKIHLMLTKKLRVFSCPKQTCRLLGMLAPGESIDIDLASMNEEAGDWLPVPWNGPGAAPGTVGYVFGGDFASAYQELPPLPKAVFAPNDEEDAAAVPAEPVPIDPQTIVGIVCQFDSDEGGLRDRRMTRGSGAIITNDGYVITARSVVDLTYLQDGMEGYSLTGCDVGQLPASAPLPSTDAIRKINAFVRIPYLAYSAEVSYIPQPGNLSDYEKAWLDFAILKISGVNPDAQYFGGPKDLPDSFPAAPFLISELPKMGEDTLNFAFPSGTTVGFGADVRTLFMQGLISHVTGYWAGDAAYADDPFLIESHLDTEDTAGGRFGSPIFWKGYVVGIHTAKQQGTRQIYSVGAKTVLQNMADSQFVIPLSAE